MAHQASLVELEGPLWKDQNWYKNDPNQHEAKGKTIQEENTLLFGSLSIPRCQKSTTSKWSRASSLSLVTPVVHVQMNLYYASLLLTSLPQSTLPSFAYSLKIENLNISYKMWYSPTDAMIHFNESPMNLVQCNQSTEKILVKNLPLLRIP